MSIKEAISIAKEWAASARALERINKKAGYTFMARDAGNEAEVLEVLISACEKYGD
jgi:hypothetical protein